MNLLNQFKIQKPTKCLYNMVKQSNGGQAVAQGKHQNSIKELEVQVAAVETAKKSRVRRAPPGQPGRHVKKGRKVRGNGRDVGLDLSSNQQQSALLKSQNTSLDKNALILEARLERFEEKAQSPAKSKRHIVLGNSAKTSRKIKKMSSSINMKAKRSGGAVLSDQKKNILKNLKKTNNSGIRRPKMSCPHSSEPKNLKKFLKINNQSLVSPDIISQKNPKNRKVADMTGSLTLVTTMSPSKLNRTLLNQISQLPQAAIDHPKERSTYRSLRNFISGTFFNPKAPGHKEVTRNNYSNSRRRKPKKIVSDVKFSNVAASQPMTRRDANPHLTKTMNQHNRKRRENLKKTAGAANKENKGVPKASVSTLNRGFSLEKIQRGSTKPKKIPASKIKKTPKPTPMAKKKRQGSEKERLRRLTGKDSLLLSPAQDLQLHSPSYPRDKNVYYNFVKKSTEAERSSSKHTHRKEGKNLRSISSSVKKWTRNSSASVSRKKRKNKFSQAKKGGLKTQNSAVKPSQRTSHNKGKISPKSDMIIFEKNTKKRLIRAAREKEGDSGYYKIEDLASSSAISNSNIRKNFKSRPSKKTKKNQYFSRIGASCEVSQVKVDAKSNIKAEHSEPIVELPRQSTTTVPRKRKRAKGAAAYKINYPAPKKKKNNANGNGGNNPTFFERVKPKWNNAVSLGRKSLNRRDRRSPLSKPSKGRIEARLSAIDEYRKYRADLRQEDSSWGSAGDDERCPFGVRTFKTKKGAYFDVPGFSMIKHGYLKQDTLVGGSFDENDYARRYGGVIGAARLPGGSRKRSQDHVVLDDKFIQVNYEAGSNNDSKWKNSHNYSNYEEATKSKQIKASKGSIDDYIIQGRKLGEGAYAVVRPARSRQSNKLVAIKTFNKFQLITKELKEAVESEIEIIQTLRHPNIVRYINKFENRRNIHLVMEYCGEQTLKHKISSKKSKQQMDYKSVFRDIVRGIGYLHENKIAHCDIKLENVVISKKNVVKIVDFGFAKKDADQETDLISGTQYYMAPELIKHERHYPIFVDVWALGVMLFYMHAKKFPFNGKKETELMIEILDNNPDLGLISDPAVRGLVQRILQVDPRSRPSCQEILESEYLKEGVGVSQKANLKPSKLIVIDRSEERDMMGAGAAFLMGGDEEPSSGAAFFETQENKRISTLGELDDPVKKKISKIDEEINALIGESLAVPTIDV